VSVFFFNAYLCGFLGDFEMMALVAVVAPPHINKNNFLSGLCGSLAFDFSTRPPEESCDREGGGFDFLLYQKKAGLQQIADDATKEAEKKEEEAAVVDTGGGGPRRTVVVNKLPDRFESKWVFLLARDRCSPYARRVGGSDKPVYVDSNTSTNLRAAESVASRRTFRSAARQPSATSTRLVPLIHVHFVLWRVLLFFFCELIIFFYRNNAFDDNHLVTKRKQLDRRDDPYAKGSNYIRFPECLFYSFQYTFILISPIGSKIT
jgi:hypothetical protein